MSGGRNAAWQVPTPEQRELLRVVLLADFPNRAAIAAFIDDVRVQPSCGCGCSSIHFRIPARIALHKQERPVHLGGASTTGISALVLLFAKDGRDFELEIAPVDDGPFGTLDPTSIRDYDRIVDGPDAETWVARDLSLIEEHPAPPD